MASTLARSSAAGCSAYARAAGTFERITALRGVTALLSWDRAAIMPDGPRPANVGLYWLGGAPLHNELTVHVRGVLWLVFTRRGQPS